MTIPEKQSAPSLDKVATALREQWAETAASLHAVLADYAVARAEAEALRVALRRAWAWFADEAEWEMRDMCARALGEGPQHPSGVVPAAGQPAAPRREAVLTEVLAGDGSAACRGVPTTTDAPPVALQSSVAPAAAETGRSEVLEWEPEVGGHAVADFDGLALVAGDEVSKRVVVIDVSMPTLDAAKAEATRIATAAGLLGVAPTAQPGPSGNRNEEEGRNG